MYLYSCIRTDVEGLLKSLGVFMKIPGSSKYFKEAIDAVNVGTKTYEGYTHFGKDFLLDDIKKSICNHLADANISFAEQGLPEVKIIDNQFCILRRLDLNPVILLTVEYVQSFYDQGYELMLI